MNLKIPNGVFSLRILNLPLPAVGFTAWLVFFYFLDFPSSQSLYLTSSLLSVSHGYLHLSSVSYSIVVTSAINSHLLTLLSVCTLPSQHRHAFEQEQTPRLPHTISPPPLSIYVPASPDCHTHLVLLELIPDCFEVQLPDSQPEVSTENARHACRDSLLPNPERL